MKQLLHRAFTPPFTQSFSKALEVYAARILLLGILIGAFAVVWWTIILTSS